MSTIILGAGVTGLAAASVSGAAAYEATDSPGGICSSYYVRPGDSTRLSAAPTDGEAYRFEIGGGHWLFGGSEVVLEYLARLAPLRRYDRRSSVFFPAESRYVAYPLQNHLAALGPDVASTALAEMALPARPTRTMRDWLLVNFGPTLSELFFLPFHELYTAGLFDRIAPQDAYKSPVDFRLAARGALGHSSAVGYNTSFAYPVDGLDGLARRMAAKSTVHYAKRATHIDTHARRVRFSDGSEVSYDTLLSTLPLNQTLAMTGLTINSEPDPFTSVLVLNIGARRGSRCPLDHWLYLARTGAGFHRVGFYDNVDVAFLPRSARERHDRTSIYAERAYVGGKKPTPEEIRDYAAQVTRELQTWEFIGATEVVDPTWIDVAYTWSWPGSGWARQATSALASVGVFSVGRYGRWVFQGIAESIAEGFTAGSAFGIR